MGFRFNRTLIQWLSGAILLHGLSVSANPQSACSIPLDETASAPAIDLIQNHHPIDRDQLIDQIQSGFDTSTLEPQLSKIFRGIPLEPNSYPPLIYPSGLEDSVDFQNALPGTSGLVRARVALTRDPTQVFQMNLSLDTHAALARNALFRKLGYAIPSPRYFKTLAVRFATNDQRDAFLDQLSTDTLTSRSRWIQNPQAADSKTTLTLVFQDLVLEPALIEVPQLHWGILTPETLDSRRSLRALLVPLTLLDIPESINLYSFEAAKIYNETILFSRANADAFKNETSIGDVKWIAKKIARLSREDWSEILHAAVYPPDIEALILEKTLARVNQLMALLKIENFRPHPFERYLNFGAIVKGKATQEKYEGYALRFTYGDPESPLRASELGRFFGIATLNTALTALLEKANSTFQFLKPDQYITEHQNKLIQQILDHFQNHPQEPYVQPIEIWGGPIAGGALNASRNIVTGTYYGSDSQIQLVDSISASVNVGGFFGVSGIPKMGLALSPSASGTRSYVHVRPLPNLKTAWKDSWGHLLVPAFLNHLSQILSGQPNSTSADSIKAFLDQLNPGELFMITDSVSTNASATAQVPLGALMGFLPAFGSLSASASLGGTYGILARTTVLRTRDGIQVYLQRAHSGSIEVDLNADFLLRILDLNENAYRGRAHTQAFQFPEKFENETQSKNFIRGIRAVLRVNNPEDLIENFNPYRLDHEVNGNRFKFALGPFSWVNRINFHRLEILPPADTSGRYHPEDFKRTVIDGQLTRISGSDFYGFFGSLVQGVLQIFKLPSFNLASSAKGDDPSSNFLGRSHTFIVDTQIEITPSRDSRPFIKIQRLLSGWSLRKARLLKIIDQLSRQLLEFNPGTGLISRDEFSQTRKVQSYQVAWDLVFNPAGVETLLRVLNLNELSTAETLKILIQVMGEKEYLAYCSERDLPAGVVSGPSAPEEDSETVIESSQGQIVAIPCVAPFMASVYQIRSDLASDPNIFKTKVRTEDEAKEKIRAINRSVLRLTRDLQVGQLMRLIGKDHSFFQSRISGFRTHDENGDSEYFSNTVGQIDPQEATGPLSDIERTSRISSNEIEARYLSNGY